VRRDSLPSTLFGIHIHGLLIILYQASELTTRRRLETDMGADIEGNHTQVSPCMFQELDSFNYPVIRCVQRFQVEVVDIDLHVFHAPDLISWICQRTLLSIASVLVR
jgi:hypothetical protein